MFNKINNHSVLKRVIKGSGWMIAGSAIPKVFILVTFVLVARIVGQDDYGKLSILRSTITMFSVFAGFGIGLTSSRFIAKYRESDVQKATEVYKVAYFFSATLGIFITVVILLFSDIISFNVFGSLELSESLRIGGFVLLFTTLNEAQNGSLSGFEDFKSISINTFVSTTLQCIIVICLAYLIGINGVIIGLGIGCLILWVLNFNSIKKKNIFIKSLKIKDISKESWVILWKFSFPAAMSGILVLPVIWWAKSFMARNIGFSDLAIYDVAEQWSSATMFLPAILGRVFLPILSNVYSTDIGSYYRTIKLNFLINVSIGIILAIIISFASNYIMSFYGKGFNDNYPLIIAIWATVFSIAASIVGQIIASSGSMWTGFFLNLCWAISFIIATLLFVGKFNYKSTGLALALLVSYVIHLCTSFMYVLYYLKLKKK